MTLKPKGWAIAEVYFLSIYRFKLHLGAGGLGGRMLTFIKYLLLPALGS